MRLALFDPSFGYYSKTITHIGARGDFTTASALTSLLARLVCSWQGATRANDAALRWAPFIEIGAGNGEFASQFLRCRPFLAQRRPYWIVETSPSLQTLQENLLRRSGIRWFQSVQEALEEAHGCAILFSNEFVDAFPCSRWIYRKERWLECGIRIAEDKVYDACFCSPLPDSTIFHQGHLTREGQLVETHESYREWLGQWSPLARHAAMLTIDYGNTAAMLYNRQPQGSLRAYWQQQRLTGAAIYSRIGCQDLTADVNFSDLEKWSRISGWDTRPSCKLADWLRAKMDESGRQSRPPAPGSAEARLLDSSDAGGAFMVLECKKLAGKCACAI